MTQIKALRGREESKIKKIKAMLIPSLLFLFHLSASFSSSSAKVPTPWWTALLRFLHFFLSAVHKKFSYLISPWQAIWRNFYMYFLFLFLSLDLLLCYKMGIFIILLYCKIYLYFVLQDSGVGKSSLVLRFVSNRFDPKNSATIG